MKGNVIMAKTIWYRYTFEDGSYLENRGKLSKRELIEEMDYRGQLISCVKLPY